MTAACLQHVVLHFNAAEEEHTIVNFMIFIVILKTV
jgi:hypothetical protein